MTETDDVVIGPLRADQREHLKTVAFRVNPVRLSLLLPGAAYRHASPEDRPVTIAFGSGSGCGQMAAPLGDPGSEIPAATVGATDIAMRGHLPTDILAFTVNRPLFRQFFELDDDSFLYERL